MKRLATIIAPLLLIGMWACGEGEVTNAVESDIVESVDSVLVTEPIDDHTLSNYKDVQVTHVHLNLEVDFEKEILKGSVVHTIKNEKGFTKVIFDSKNLNIQGVQVDGADAVYEVGEYDELLGSPLNVTITAESNKVEIFYETTPETEALDWVDPSLTLGKIHPYVFTQGQSILTRTWVPLMDTPGLRVTYSADMKVPAELMAVMSADNPTEKNPEGKYHFEMTNPVPCYLMALAVGDLEFAPLDHRTGVYTEHAMLEACVNEFKDVPQMVNKAEGLYGPYLWGRYDIIVLPPSFPFGGMENPMLTFATPTIIAGDGSLVSLVAHELAHSWSGNLVTNATWNDFWLNEGFTVYFERRIMEEVYDKDFADMLAILGYQDLQGSLKSQKPADQILKLKLSGRHPDDGMTDIAYEKGCFFLKMIEEATGREKFDVFLKEYFEVYKFQTLTTEDFITYLNKALLDPNDLDLNVQEWVYEPGVPANCPVVVSEAFNEVERQMNAFYLNNDVNEIKGIEWSYKEWYHLLSNLKDETSVSQMEALDAKFDFSNNGNSEIAFIWFEKSIRFGYKAIDQKLEDFLVRVGRRKFLTPLYKALKETDQLDRALEIYAKARPNYHSVSFHTMDALLGYEA
jgi:leukotriene-A4 hydrolase